MSSKAELPDWISGRCAERAVFEVELSLRCCQARAKGPMMLRAAKADAAEGSRVMMMVVIFAMVFVLLALGAVCTLMFRSHRHAVQHSTMTAAKAQILK
jgi:hypothetical protein